MFMFNTVREINIIEAYYNEKLIGKFINMRTARDKLGKLADKVIYKFNVPINEKTNNKLFWKLIEKGFVLSNTKSR